jgi:diaminopimelate decarboxylase
LKKHTAKDIQEIYRAAKAARFFEKDAKAIIFYDTDLLDDRLNILKRQFPQQVLHAIAVKTHSSPEVLRHISDRGFGLEAASIEEVKMALAAGVPSTKIVFDSPVKTRAEITYCHEHLEGIYVNANSLQELERYPKDFRGNLGLRINPLVSSDAPSIFDVAQKTSKFGVPISKRQEILNAFDQYPQLIGLHIHIGSGIKNFAGNLEAVKRILALAKEIDRPLEFIDIGGGIDFEDETGDFSVAAFVQALKTECPELFDYQVITEYGKFVHKYNSFAASKIEYVLEADDQGETGTAYIHLGADLFLRKVYSQLNIQYPYSVLQQQEVEEKRKYNIAGPLCFAGDFIFYDLELPKLAENDVFFIHNMGANTLSMWSRHCSRELPEYLLFSQKELLATT